MTFWWASQSQTYSAIEEGTLWTCLMRDGTALASRTLIKELRVGDLVFNYARGSVRALSRVVVEWVPALRPSSHAGKDGDPDVGWLVRTEPIVTGLSLDWHELRELIGVGSPGPLDKDGIPQQRYISVISDEEGRRLLDRLAIAVDVPGERPIERLSIEELWDLGETDAVTIGLRRREQARLRAYLLGRRAAAGCDICGRELPAALLVAAHIVPRAVSDNEHRKDFASIAMLACSLGCDDLFERGYLFVDDAGVVRGGRAAETSSLASAVDQLTSSVCTAHNERTAAAFAAHARLVLA
jgi:hypothetical protein